MKKTEGIDYRNEVWKGFGEGSLRNVKFSSRGRFESKTKGKYIPYAHSGAYAVVSILFEGQ